jgi:dipeptidyl aminopeptidase/acylaminoacyl peptidase
LVKNESRFKQIGRKVMDDIEDGQYVIKQGWVDMDGMAIAGGHGGYATLMGLVKLLICILVG